MKMQRVLTGQILAALLSLYVLGFAPLALACEAMVGENACLLGACPTGREEIRCSSVQGLNGANIARPEAPNPQPALAATPARLLSPAPPIVRPRHTTLPMTPINQSSLFAQHILLTI